MKLTELNPGEQAIVVSVPLYRMQELGLIPGTRLLVVSKGPFGNPVEITYGGSPLLIDRRTARETEVLPCN